MLYRRIGVLGRIGAVHEDRCCTGVLLLCPEDVPHVPLPRQLRVTLTSGGRLTQLRHPMAIPGCWRGDSWSGRTFLRYQCAC